MHSARRWVPLVLIPVLVAGCSGEDPDQPDPTATAAAFPVTVGTGEATVEIPARPERIVSLSATATDMLYAIGAGDQVVAVDAESDYPPEAPTTELSGWDPNLEAVSDHEPDLVVVSNDPGGLVSGLDQLGVPTLVHPAAATLEDTYTQLEQLGAATGHADEAADLVTGLRQEIDEIAAEAPERPEPLTYYHELDETYYSVTSGTFLGELYGLLDLESIADEVDEEGGGYPQLSAEFIVDADPDVILLATAECCGVDAEQVAERPGWDRLTAVREGRVIELVDDTSQWGPRMVEFLRTVAAELAAVS